MPQNGFYFVNWCLRSVHKLIDSMSNVWTFMVTPIKLPDLNNTYLALLLPFEFPVELVPIDFMFFGGIIFYLVWIFGKFITDIAS